MECLEGLKMLPDNSIDAIITDPPYGLSFMGKKWDYDVPSVDIWKECLRVLKPGGHLLAFAGTRTQHRMAVRIEDAGFEIRDMISWVYGSGFPKSLNIGKAVDKLQGNERDVIDRKDVGHDITNNSYKDNKTERKIMDITKGKSEREGRGTALKPALEPITLARKPIEGTVAENCLKWGTGGINIDESRVEHNEELKVGFMKTNREKGLNSTSYGGEKDNRTEDWTSTQGRFPANFIHDGSDEVVELFPTTKQPSFRNGDRVSNNDGIVPWNKGRENGREVKGAGFTDTGSASRFFYCAKASKSERNMGMSEGESNGHPTVKPIALMEYLVNMVTKQDGIVLDPFAGSGTTLMACKKLGRKYVGYEMDAEYCKIAEARMQTV